MNKLVLTGLLAAGTMTHLQGAQPAGQRPNILFILSDDHTSQAWGIYGGVLAEYAHNANIRRLAKEGVVLDNCFCTNSISAPSRAQYPHRSIQSPEQTVHPCGLTGHLHPHPCHPATSQRIPHRTRRQMAYPVATARVRLLLYLLRPGRIPRPYFHRKHRPVAGNRRFGERVLGFSTDLVTEKAINCKAAGQQRTFPDVLPLQSHPRAV